VSKNVKVKQLWEIWHSYIVWLMVAASVIIVWNKVPVQRGVGIGTIGEEGYMKDLAVGSLDGYFNRQTPVSYKAVYFS
jgi:hypothetical protein